MKQYISEWKVYLKDNNPGALEKALNCFNIFIDKIHKSIMTPEDVNPILSMLVEKCLTHMKPVIKKLAGESVIALFVAFESFEESQDALIALAGHKVPKVSFLSIVFLILLIIECCCWHSCTWPIVRELWSQEIEVPRFCSNRS